MDGYDLDIDVTDVATELSDVEDVEADAEVSELDDLPDAPEYEEECEDIETGPVLAKTYDGWGTVMPSADEGITYEGYKNLEGIYENAMDTVTENDETSTDVKIQQLEALKEQWKSEFGE